MIMKNVCLVDLDDTLADFRTPMIEIVNRVTGKDTEWKGYDVPEDAGLTHSEFIEILIKEDIINNVNNNVLIMEDDKSVIVDVIKKDIKVVFSDSDESHPLIIIDGKESTREEMDTLDSDNIEKVEVLKGKSATGKYGVKAKDGVILITTK